MASAACATALALQCLRPVPTSSARASEEAIRQPPAVLFTILALQGRIAYRRIPTGLPHTDPFSGTYLAGFGPHGIEILLLTRKIDKGHEIVTARKLTGRRPSPAPTTQLKNDASVPTNTRALLCLLMGRHPCFSANVL